MENKTGYNILTSEGQGVLEIVIKGNLTESSVEALHTEVLDIIRGSHSKALLCDIRSAKGPQNITEAYFRVREIPPHILKLPAAIVYKSVSEEYKSFYETTAANVGQSVKWFENVQDAREWLLSLIKET